MTREPAVGFTAVAGDAVAVVALLGALRHSVTAEGRRVRQSIRVGSIVRDFRQPIVAVRSITFRFGIAGIVIAAD
jgi:hypothetical protein